MLAAESVDKEADLTTEDLNDPVCDEKQVPDSREYLCIHETPRPAMPQPIPVTPPSQQDQGILATLPQQSDQVELPLEY